MDKILYNNIYDIHISSRLNNLIYNPVFEKISDQVKFSISTQILHTIRYPLIDHLWTWVGELIKQNLNKGV
jgi:hypothetical protein